MACGSCGKKSSKPNLPAAAKTTGAWKLTLPGGEVRLHSTRVGAQSENLRYYGGKGTVTKA